MFVVNDEGVDFFIGDVIDKRNLFIAQPNKLGEWPNFSVYGETSLI